MDRNELAGRLDGERYSIDADESGIRARVADAITGALMFGAQGVNAPPAGHWLTPFWEMARADAAANPTITASVSASDDYDLIDGFLRNNIDDADYADYSAALDRIYLAKPPAAALRESEEWRRDADVLFREAAEQIRWWEREHGCCRGVSDETLAKLDAAIDAARKDGV